MKNHWLQNYKNRTDSYWTVEFYNKKTYILSPRRVCLINFQKYTNGNLGLRFKNASHMQGDHPLNLLFGSCVKYIDCWTSKICNYTKINFKESFELSDLSFVSLNLDSNFEDIILKFDYQILKKLY